MTEKRFSLAYEDYDWWAICDKENEIISGEKVVDLLNALHEENEQLKQQYNKLRHYHSNLHDECLELESAKDRLQKDVEWLEKENEQLKRDIEYWKQVASQYSNELNVNDFTKSRNDKEKNCGYCKNYNLDGMFGIWCSIHETPTSDKYCQDFEWNRR